jgi:hypothetical protein
MRAWFTAVTVLFLSLTARPALAGYTHYWTWKIVPDEKRLEACVGEMEKIADKSRAILADRNDKTGADAVFRGRAPFGDGAAVPDIAFNGIGNDAHETFAFPLAAFAGTPAFSFVKTQWKPYDTPVVASLIVARDHFTAAELEITSDGTWEREWTAGAQLYEQTLGRNPKNPLVTTPPSFPSISPFTAPSSAPPSASSPLEDIERARRHRIGWFALAGAAVIAVILMRARA